MRMTTMSMNQEEEEEDPMLILSQYYSDIYTQTSQGETRVRRRRKKNKGESAGMGWKKRRLSDEQVKSLELNFGSEHKLESARKNRLAMELGLDPRQVAVWFQNRRARWKGKQLEEEYTRLKTTHEAAVVDKCKLEAEVLKLREELSEARKEIKKLAEQFDGVSEGERSCSPRSCISMDTHQAFLGEFGTENAQDFFYMPENGTYVCEMEWLDLFGP